MNIPERFNLVQSINASIEEALRDSIERVPGFTGTAAAAGTEPAPMTDEQIVDRTDQLLRETEELLDALRESIPKLSTRDTLNRINTSLTAIKQMKYPPEDGRVKRIFDKVTNIQERCAVKLSPPPLFSYLPKKYREICLHSSEENWKNLEELLTNFPIVKEPYLFCLLDLIKNIGAEDICNFIALIVDFPVEDYLSIETLPGGEGKFRLTAKFQPWGQESFEEFDPADMVATVPESHQPTALLSLFNLFESFKRNQEPLWIDKNWSFLRRRGGSLDIDKIIGLYFALKYLGLEKNDLFTPPADSVALPRQDPEKIRYLFQVFHENNPEDFQRKYLEPFNIKFPECLASKAPDTILTLDDPDPEYLSQLSKGAKNHVEELLFRWNPIPDLRLFPSVKKLKIFNAPLFEMSFKISRLNGLPEEVKSRIKELQLSQVNLSGEEVLNLTGFTSIESLDLSNCPGFTVSMLNDLPDTMKRGIKHLYLSGLDKEGLDLTKFPSLETVSGVPYTPLGKREIGSSSSSDPLSPEPASKKPKHK